MTTSTPLDVAPLGTWVSSTRLRKIWQKKIKMGHHPGQFRNTLASTGIWQAIGLLKF